MRHQKRINHLGRTHSHRKAMISNMASSLILHKRITTTLAKAKALRIYVEPLITRSKDDSTHSRRLVFSYLQNKEAVSELFRDISQKVAERPGGYTRILKTGNRAGDNAEMCIIELVDYNETYLGGKGEAKAKTTRRKRTAPKKKAAGEAVAAKEEEIKEVKEVKEVKEEAHPAEPEPEKTEKKTRRSSKKTSAGKEGEALAAEDNTPETA